jgi:hypothetical protein
MKIERAYCLQLGIEVNIDEALREFRARPPGTPRFRYVCNDAACTQARGGQPARISGVNDHLSAEEALKFKAAHFRERDVHAPVCRWVIEEHRRATALLSDHAIGRRAHPKTTDEVTTFDPRLDVPTTQVSHGASGRIEPSYTVSTPPDEGNSARPRENSGGTKTSVLERFVQSYIEQRRTLSPRAFYKRTVRIVGKGKVKLANYFQTVDRSDGSGITYGLAKLHKTYGRGFKLQFFKHRESSPVWLYAPKELMQTSRDTVRINEIIEQMRTMQLLKVMVYALGKMTYSNAHQCFNVQIDDIRHLYLAPEPIAGNE